MNIVTGYTGQPHVTSNAAQGFNQGIFGAGNYVLNVGNRFEAELTNANTVTIADGEGVLQGVHFRINPGTTETVNISNGTSGYKRIDYICARYTKNAITGVETVDLVVVEGTPATSTPTAPTVNTGDVLTGGSPVDFPLYEVDVDDLTPTLKSIFEKTISPVSQFVSPPDLMNITIVERITQSTGDLVINESGWYALQCNSPNGYASISRYFSGDLQQYLPVAAGMCMTPWVYLRKDTSGLKYEHNGTVAIFMKAELINDV